MHGFGALFPDGYAPLPDPDGKGPRWTCPVEFCTHERTYLKSHGKHFRKDHKACQLNDNGDGTFTVVGYNMDQNAPVVVSRNIKAGTATMSATGAAAVSVEERDVSDDAESVSVPTGKHRGELDGDSDAPYFFTPSGRPYTTYPSMFLRRDTIRLSKSLTFRSPQTILGARTAFSSRMATNGL